MANNSANYNVNMRFTADTGQAKQQLRDLQSSLDILMNQIATKDIKFFNVNATKKEIDEASAAVQELKIALDQATNVDTGRLDLSKFSKSLSQSGYTLQDFATHLENLGPTGDKAFVTLAQSVINAEVPLKRTNKLLDDFKKTLMNTAKWQISSNFMHGVQGSLQKAYYYAEDLNKSLNEIRIVTGQSNDQMAQFAEKANKAAQALSTTTTNYTNASLIYYQQGLSDKEVADRTEVTIKMANAAGESASKVSDQLTAVWNNFYDGSKSLEYYADVMTKLGAYTASSTDEISEGIQKFASVANTIGLSYEYATSALATLTAKTRESANTVGNSFKTLFARIQGLTLGETLEDGTDLNKYSKALEKVGINIKDQQGELKDMNTILDEMMNKWDSLSRAEQVALAQTVGGVRQYTQLVNLMENKDYFKELVGVAKKSEGTLQEQADIYAESWEASKKRVQASLEEIYKQLVNDKFFIGLNDTLSDTINLTSKLIDSLGGLPGVLSVVSTLMLKSFGPDIVNNMQRMASNLFIDSGAAESQSAVMKQQMIKTLRTLSPESKTPLNDQSSVTLETTTMINAAQASYDLQIANSQLNETDKQRLQTLLKISQAYGQIAIDAKRSIEAQQDQSYNNLRNVRNTIFNSNNADFGGDKGIEYFNKNYESGKKMLDNFYNDKTIQGLKSSKIDQTGSFKDFLGRFDGLGLDTNADSKFTKLNNLLEKAKTAKPGARGTLRKQIIQEVKDLTDANVQIDKYANGKKKADGANRSLIEGLRACLTDYAKEKTLLEQSDGANKKYSDTIDNFNEILANGQGAISNFSEGLVTSAQGISQFSVGIISLKGLLNTLKNDDLDFGEKLASGITSATIAIPSLINGFKSFSQGIKEVRENWSGLGANILSIATGLDAENLGAALKEKIDSGSQNFENTIKGKILNAGAKAYNDKIAELKDSLNGLTGEELQAAQAANDLAASQSATKAMIGASIKTLGIYAAALAAIAAAVYLLIRAYNTMNSFSIDEQIKRSEQAINNFKDQLDETKNKAEQLKTVFDNYNSIKSALDECTVGTKEWREQLSKANEEALNILNTYPELKNMEGAWGKKDTGEIWIDKNAIGKLQSIYDKQITQQQYALANEQSNLEDLNIKKAKQDLTSNLQNVLNIQSGTQTGGLTKNGQYTSIISGIADLILNNQENLQNKSQEEQVGIIEQALKDNGFETVNDNTTLNDYAQSIVDKFNTDDVQAAISNVSKVIQANTDATLQATKEASVQQALGLDTMSTEDAKITTALVDANVKAIKDSFYNTDGTFSWDDGTGVKRTIGTYGENAGGIGKEDQALRNLWDAYLNAAKIDKNDSEYRLDQKNSVIGDGQNRSFQLENGKTIAFSEVATVIATVQAMGEELQTTYAMAQKFQTGMNNQGTVGQGILEFFGNNGDLGNFTQEQLEQLVLDLKDDLEDEDLQNLIGQSLFGKDFNILEPEQQETVKSYMSNMMKELGVTSGKELSEAIVEEAGHQIANIEDIKNNKVFKYILGLGDKDDISEAIDEFEGYSVSLKSRISQIAEDIFKVAGKDGVVAFKEAINAAGKDLTLDQLNKIADFDWSSGTWEEFIDTLKDLGIVVSDDEGAWRGFYNMMQETANKLPIEDFTTFRDLLIEIFDLMGQDVGSSITKEKYDEITKGLKAAGLNSEDYYVQTGPDEYTKVKDFDTKDKNALTQAGIDRAEEQHNVAETAQDNWNDQFNLGTKIRINGQDYDNNLAAMAAGDFTDVRGRYMQQMLDIFGSPEEIAKLVGTDEVGNYDLDYYKKLNSSDQADIIQKIIDAYMANIDGSYNSDLLRTNAYTDANSVKEMSKMTGFDYADEASQNGLQAWAANNQDIEGNTEALNQYNRELELAGEDTNAVEKATEKFYNTLRDNEIREAVKGISELKTQYKELREEGEDTTEVENDLKQSVKDLFNLSESDYEVNQPLVEKFLWGNDDEAALAGQFLELFGKLDDQLVQQINESAGKLDFSALQTAAQTKLNEITNLLSQNDGFVVDGRITADASQALAALAPLGGTIEEMCGYINAMGQVGIHFNTSQLQILFNAFQEIAEIMKDPTNADPARIAELKRTIGDTISVASEGSLVTKGDGGKYLTTENGNNKGGGGGGGSESKSANDIGKEIQDELLKTKEKKRDRLEALRDGANPEDSAKYIQEEIKLLKEEQDILEDQIKSWKKLLKLKVEEFNKENPEFEIKLTDDGEIANASELWGKVWAQYQKNLEDGMSEEDLNEWFTKIKDSLDGPMGIQQNIDENVALIAQKEKEAAELELEAITKAIDWKVKQIDYQIKRLNYYQEKLLKQAHGNKQTIEAMLEGFAYQEQEMLQLFDKGATLRQGIDQLNAAKAKYPGYEQMFDEQILEYQSDLIDVNEAILDLRNDIEDLVQNVLDLALDEIDKQIERLDTYTSMLDHLNNIIDLSGRSMLDMGLKTQIGATKVETMLGKMKSLKAQMDGLAKATKEAQAALADRQADGDTSSVKFWENQVEVLKQETEKASDEFLASWEETLEAAQDLFEMRVEMAVNVLSNALSPFETLEDFQDKYEKAKTINEEYLDDAERLYELNKLNRQLNLQLADTNDLLAKQKLRDIQQEIHDLQADGVQMSQYDLEYLQKKYDLQLAEIALMEQQNSKTSMRLVRDAAGNWTYAYDADEEKIEDATQKYEDAVHELGQLSKDYINDVSEQLIQNQIDFKEALQDLDKNSADYSNQLLSLQEYYVERQRYLLDELNKGVVNSGLTFHDTLYGQMTDLYDYNDAYMLFVNNSNTTISELQTNYKDWQKVVEAAMNVAGTSWETFGSDMGGTLDSLEEHIQKLCDEIEELVNVLMGYISQSIGMVLDWEQKYSKRTDEELAKNEQYIDGNFGSSGGGSSARNLVGVDLSAIAIRMKNGESTVVDKNGNVWTSIDDVVTARNEKLDNMRNGGDELKNDSSTEYWNEDEKKQITSEKDEKWLDDILNGNGAASGAYTGNWAKGQGFGLDNGKIIKVHPKELILNQKDTSNILRAVDIVRNMNDWVDKQVQSMINFGQIKLGNLIDKTTPPVYETQPIKQEVTIQADFPGVTDHYEIEEALSNLSNNAAQYISANKSK